MSDHNAKMIEEFRSNEGELRGWFEDKPVLLLTSIGARSGKQRVTPLMYREEGDDSFIFASYAGADRHPDWYYNLKANPEAAIEIGSDEFQVRATEVTGGERDRIYEAMASDYSNFAEYQEKTDRRIPVFALSREE